MSGKKILIVDDEPVVLEFLEELLARQGYEVEVCISVDEACRALRRKDVDAVVADLVLKPGTGLDILDYINHRKLNVPFILMSGRAEMDDVIDAFQRNAVEFVTKPVEEKALTAALRKALK